MLHCLAQTLGPPCNKAISNPLVGRCPLEWTPSSIAHFFLRTTLYRLYLDSAFFFCSLLSNSVHLLVRPEKLRTDLQWTKNWTGFRAEIVCIDKLRQRTSSRAQCQYNILGSEPHHFCIEIIGSSTWDSHHPQPGMNRI